MMKKIYIPFLLLIVALGCEKYDPVEMLNPIANNLKKVAARNFGGCVIRYNLVGYYSRLSESVQRKSVDNAFSIWQKVNPNMQYFQSPDTAQAEISIRFTNAASMKDDNQMADYGIMKTSIQPVSQLRQIKGNQYEILLNNSHNWDETLITKVVAYQIGSYLGFPSSEDPASVMYAITTGFKSALSKEDSLLYNQLYSLPCSEISNPPNPTIPLLTLKLSNPISRDLRLDKAGTVFIHSSGSIVVGDFIGACSPDGKTQFSYLGFVFDIDAVSYNIEPAFPHGAVMYKINNESRWRLCGSNCEFSTKGNENITLTLQLNDKDTSDNRGVFDVEINYK